MNSTYKIIHKTSHGSPKVQKVMECVEAGLMATLLPPTGTHTQWNACRLLCGLEQRHFQTTY